ncbi:MAPEG family protein [Sinorhizobium sp. 8-89]|uniref:MAPEG family protein n=1 Tax=Sinorhizobium sp. 7-81 TaxID=3049087 RepID=UPI0024C2DECD|nr:MAPEG family protein [Sinorhizobium sp. 7-81]MDK1384471.1 MAPEG family protein [Sinorhizobium sp. 7-81]
MTGFEIFWPMVAHALLVFALYALLSARRVSLVRTGKVEASQFRENRHEPAESLVVRNSIANQFELPVLFHICCVLLYITEADNLVSLGLAWLFVALRYVHAAVHVTSNRLRYRRPLFITGFVTLLAMWGWLCVWMATS